MTIPFDNPSELERLERNFACAWGLGAGHLYRGCIATIDGLVIKLRKPPKTAHASAMAFFCGRYKCFGVAMQAMCDSNLKRLWFTANSPGSVHDSVAFKSSRLYQLLEEGKLDPRFHISGDGAYTESDYLFSNSPTPRSHKLETGKDAFNWIHSSHRQCIERAFGQLVGHWLVLEKLLRVNLARVSTVVHACMLLQNVCINRRLSEMTVDATGKRDLRLPACKPVVLETGEAASREFAGARGSHAVPEKKRKITARTCVRTG